MGNRRRRAPGRDRDPDTADNIRGQRLQELIREEVNLVLRDEIRDARLQAVSITMVELARDGSCARLWFTSRTEANVVNDNETKIALERAAGFLRARLAESLMLKRIPELRFRSDPATRSFRQDI